MKVLLWFCFGVIVVMWLIGNSVRTPGSQVSPAAVAKTPTTEPTPTVPIPTSTAAAQPTPSAPPAQPARDEVDVLSVIDASSIQIRFGHGQVETVRYIGVETPESRMCFGPEAMAKNAELVGGRTVYLERDGAEADGYGRLLRYVWVKGDDGAERMVNEELIKWGYARIISLAPEAKYGAPLKSDLDDAKAGRRGVWGACSEFGAPLPAKRDPLPTPSAPVVAGPPHAPATGRGYVRDVSDQVTALSDSFGRLSPLLGRAAYSDPSWQKAVRNEIALWKELKRAIRSLVVPDEYKMAHLAFVYAFDSAASAGDDLTEVLDDPTNALSQMKANFFSQKLKSAKNFIETGTDMIQLHRQLNP